MFGQHLPLIAPDTHMASIGQACEQFMKDTWGLCEAEVKNCEGFPFFRESLYHKPYENSRSR